MNIKTTATLFIIAVALGMYIFATSEHGSSKKELHEQHQLVDFASVNDVAKVVMTDAAGKKTTLEKTDKKWRLTDPVNAAADDTEAATLQTFSISTTPLQKLLSIRLIREHPRASAVSLGSRLATL